jgi:hypothetical protein
VAPLRRIGADIVFEIEHGMAHSVYLSDPLPGMRRIGICVGVAA